jgi:short subunit dehydrogenase-like uncharacterized protein
MRISSQIILCYTVVFQLVLFLYLRPALGFRTPLFTLPNHPSATSKSAIMLCNKGADASSLSENRRKLHSIVEQDGKSVETIPTPVFLLVVVVLLPIWVTILLPLTAIWQLGRSISLKLRDALFPKQDDDELSHKYDSGYQVDPMDIIPRPQRKYDVVLLGSTGFTGRLATRHMIKTYGCANDDGRNGKGVQWAIAGRNQARLDRLKESLAKELNAPQVLNLDTIIVDTSIPSNLPDLVSNTRVVVSTAGPFSVYGSSVVEFAAKYGTHYADITGETSWVQNMMYLWQRTALQTGAKMISFCGNDCVPWDLTVLKAYEKVEQEGEEGETLESIQIIDEVCGGVSGGTILTMSLGMNGKLPPTPKSDPFQLNAEGKVLARSPMNNCLSWTISRWKLPWNGQQAYVSPFVMSQVNYQVLSWTQSLFGRENVPLAYSESQISPDFKTAFANYAVLNVFFTALLNPVTSYVLRSYVLPKPGQGPSLEKMEKTHFSAIYAVGKGTKGSEVESLIYFPRDCGYYDTARMVVECGLALALEEKRLPVSEGGFYTPAYGLGNVLLHRLLKTGTFYDAFVIKPQKLETRS